MCGIFGYVGGRNATKIVFEGLKSLEYRGYDSWGTVAVGSSELTLEKHVGKIGSSQLTLGSSKTALGHTRWATHGGVTDENAHPHQDCTGSIAVVHNGIIENYLELKKKLLEGGHKFVSETDTEVFAHLVEEAQKKLSFADAVKASFARLKGLNTIVAINQEGDLVACKNGSPLVVGQGKSGELYVSSDMPSLLVHTHDIAVIKDKGVVVIQGGKLITPLKFTRIDMDQEVADKGKFAHYLLKEIYDQPESLHRLSLSDQVRTSAARKMLAESKSIYAVGCGTAFFAMLTSSYIFAKYSSLQVIPLAANEFNSFAHLLDSDSVVLFASQSGETMDTISALRLAKLQGAKTVSLVNVPGSTLARESDIYLPLLAGVERAVASTKAFMGMLGSLLLLTNQAKEVQSANKLIDQMLKSELPQNLQELALKLQSHKHLFLLGRGINYPLALEGALKLKETSYIHAEGFASGELKHGVIALIEPGTPCLVLVAEDEEKFDILSGAMELKARGAWIIGIGPSHEEVYDDWIEVPNNAKISPLLNVVPLQLLGYYLALAKKIDPDMPRNLAKSVTVK